MEDRELLELAAKAAGIGGGWGDKIEYHNGAVDLRDVWILEGDGFVPWNPLTDDGDALRLAVKLNIGAQSLDGLGYSLAISERIEQRILFQERHEGSNPNAATRRAIVRAAAEIGRAM